MKYLPLILLIFLISCNNNADTKKSADVDSSTQAETPAATTTEPQTKSLSSTSTEILQLLKTKNFSGLSEYVHPDLGIRFSPYGYIDTNSSIVISKDELKQTGIKNKVYTWGQQDGSGIPIKISVDTYINTYVYDVDFLNAEKTSENKFIGAGNSLNNLEAVFPGADFTEHYFSGFDPQYEGMDWKTLRLVYTKENNRYWLVAIVHDQWTV